MVVCRMTLMVCKKKRSETEKKTKWWKLKKEECCEEFRQKLRQALGGQVLLPDDWETTAEVIRETGRKVLGVSSGRRKEDKETWWWNEEVQDSIQRKRLAKKKWDMDRTEENRQGYKELQRRVKREVSKSKQKEYDELYTRLDTREGEKDLYRLARQRDREGCAANLEKAYDRLPREELWYCMRKSGVAEKYVRVVQDMYERSRTVVRCAVVMDQLSEEVRQESPWTMMFADDIVICSESREQVEENLERWRFALERRGMKVSRSKTEYMCVNEKEGSGTVRLQGEEVKKVQEFKYLGSTVQSNGECGKEVKKRVQAGWNGWRKVSGVLCDGKISARIKGKVYRTVVRPAMLYGLETVSLRKRQESELEVAELKILRFFLGVTRLDRIRNEYIRGTAHVGRLGDKVSEAELTVEEEPVGEEEDVPGHVETEWSSGESTNTEECATAACPVEECAAAACPVEECAAAVAKLIGVKSIVTAARMNKSVVMFVDDVSKAETVVLNGVVIKGTLVKVFPLSTPARRVILSNVPPFINDEDLCTLLSWFGKVVSPVKMLRTGCKDPELRHIYSYRQQAFMILNNRDEDLNVIFKTKTDGEEYTIYATSGSLKCFGCGQEGHLARNCPEEQATGEQETGTVTENIQEREQGENKQDSGENNTQTEDQEKNKQQGTTTESQEGRKDTEPEMSQGDMTKDTENSTQLAN
ncbi:hypothetical protein QTP70_004943, partial [Hemibagrus guttatus]